VLSLVSSDATDIRDRGRRRPSANLDQRAFRANLFVVVGSVLFVLGRALLALAGPGPAVLALREAGGGERPPDTDATILRGGRA